MYHFVDYNNKDLLKFIFASVSFVEGSTSNSQNSLLREIVFLIGKHNLVCFNIYHNVHDTNYIDDFRQLRLDLVKV